LLVPTYFTEQPPDIHYDGEVDIAENLTTNSVLADVGYRHGVLGLAVALLALLVACLAAGHLSRYSNYVIAGAGILLYAVAETWRIYMLNTGIIHALLLALLVSALPLPARLQRGLTRTSRVVRRSRQPGPERPDGASGSASPDGRGLGPAEVSSRPSPDSPAG
jgi:hypothetical protein